MNYYYGFVERGRNPFRFLSQAGFVVFLVFTLLMAYIARTEDDGLSSIDDYIAVYPRVESVHFVPGVSSRNIQHWQVESRDTIADIRAFYTDPANLRDWTLIREEPVLVLERNSKRLTITTGEKPARHPARSFITWNTNKINGKSMGSDSIDSSMSRQLSGA